MISNIMENLYICNMDEVIQAISEHDIEAIVNVAHEVPQIDFDGSYTKIPMKDDLVDEYGRELFRIAVAWSYYYVGEGKRTLVHCHEGRNRSSSVCIAVVRDKKNLDWANATKFVKEKHEPARKHLNKTFFNSIIKPNPDNKITQMLRDMVLKEFEMPPKQHHSHHPRPVSTPEPKPDDSRDSLFG